MEGHDILGQLVLFHIVDLVEESLNWLVVSVAQDDPCPVMEGHGPEAVEPAARVDCHGNGFHPTGLGMATAEEVAKGDADGRCLFTIPVAF